MNKEKREMKKEKREMNKERIRNMCLAGVLTAAVFVSAAYLHIPVGQGYVHIGDAFIFLAASLLPAPYAVFTGAAGAALADCLSGYAVYAPASLIIKGLTALCFSSRGKKILSKRNLTALVPAAVLCAGGYYLYEIILTKSLLAPVSGLVGNLMQSVFSAVIFVITGAALNKKTVFH